MTETISSLFAFQHPFPYLLSGDGHVLVNIVFCTFVALFAFVSRENASSPSSRTLEVSLTSL